MNKLFRPRTPAPKAQMMTTHAFMLVNSITGERASVPAGVIVPVYAKRRSKDGLVLCMIQYDGVAGWAKERDLVKLEEVVE